MRNKDVLLVFTADKFVFKAHIGNQTEHVLEKEPLLIRVFLGYSISISVKALH